MDEAPYSRCAFFWAATVGLLSLGFHASGSVTAAVAPNQSTVKVASHRFSERVSTYLTAPCAGFLHSRRVPTLVALVHFVLAALSRLGMDVRLGMLPAAGRRYP